MCLSVNESDILIYFKCNYFFNSLGVYKYMIIFVKTKPTNYEFTK